ncbi:MAG: response regulator [Ignavibacteria bacterium]|nr:response regulator [Ignavibacteria bacterium]
MERNLQILLVEDNLLNQKLVALNLKKFNHTVVIANDGYEAIEKFSENKFDLILMDVMMPLMDGLQATIKIREIESAYAIENRTPIIALTGNAMADDRKKCFSAGMDEFMTKPFNIGILISKYNELKNTTGYHAVKENSYEGK